MNHDPGQTRRPRGPQDLFGFERELWEDRGRGAKVAGFSAQLSRAALNVDLALDREEGNPHAIQRLQAMAAALQAAKEVLTAASRAAQQLGSAGPVIRG